MNRRIMAVATAFMILAAAVWFPAQTVYASDFELDTGIQQIGVSIHPGGEASVDTLDDTVDEPEDDTEPETTSENDTEPETDPEPETDVQTLGLGGGGLGGDDGLGGDGGLGGSDLGGDDAGEQESSEEKVISEFPVQYYQGTYFLEVGGDPRGLPLKTAARGFYGRFDFEEFEILWRYDDFDSSTPGKYIITGDIVLTEGYACSCEPIAWCPVTVYDPDGQPAAIVEWVDSPVGTLSNRMVPLGISGGELAEYINDNTQAQPGDPIWIKTEDGDDYDGVLTGWDASLVDISTPGVYYPFFINPPPGVGFPEWEGQGVKVRGAEIYVVDPDEVCLFAMELDHYGFGFLDVCWIKEIDEPELWLSVDGGEWNRIYEDHDWRGNNGLEIKLYNNNSIFQPGHTYELEVRYENGGVSVDTLIVDYTGGKPEVRTPGGDRNGYDRDPEGQTPPDDGGEGDGDGDNDVDSPGNDNGGDQGGNEDPPGGSDDNGEGDNNNDNGGGNSDPEDQDNGDNGNGQGDGITPADGEETGSGTREGSGSSGRDRTGNGNPDSDSVTPISMVTGEGPPPVTPLDVAANLPSDSLQEPHRLGLNAPASNTEDSGPSSMRDEDQAVRPAAIQDTAPDELPDIPAAHTEEPQAPAPLPFTLPLTLGGVTGLSCTGLVLMKKWRVIK